MVFRRRHTRRAPSGQAVVVEAHHVQVPAAPVLPPSAAALGRLRVQADSQAADDSEGELVLAPDGLTIPVVHAEELQAGFDLVHRLHSWASTAQALASDRERRLKAINPNAYTADLPFSAEEWGNDRYYDTVTLGYALDGTSVPTVQFRGRRYSDPHSNASTAVEINLPGWVLAPGGVDRYRSETDRLVGAEQAKEDAWRAKLLAAADGILNDVKATGGRDGPPVGEAGDGSVLS